MDLDPTSVDITKSPEDYNEPVYDENGKLTHASMQRIVRQGGGIMYGHAVLTTPESLPTEAQLAKGDAVKMAAAAENIRQQMAALQAQLQTLGVTPDAHIGHSIVPSMSAVPPGSGILEGKLGEGDTAGIDGDKGNPDTAAGQAEADERARRDDNAARAAEVQAKFDAAKADNAEQAQRREQAEAKVAAKKAAQAEAEGK